MSDMADEAYASEKLEIEAAVEEALEPLAGCETGPVWEGETPHCRRCGVIIPQERLEAVPCTGLCVRCAALAQQDQPPFDQPL